MTMKVISIRLEDSEHAEAAIVAELSGAESLTQFIRDVISNEVANRRSYLAEAASEALDALDSEVAERRAILSKIAAL